MTPLNLPTYSFKTRKRENREEIFDEIRRKWLVCTPEEWVRQNFLKWLKQEKNYPASNLVIEGGLKLNKLQKRTDILAYKTGNPHLLIECKAPNIAITQKTFDQLFRYNIKIKAPFLAVTNGLQHVFASYNADKNEVTFLRELPVY